MFESLTQRLSGTIERLRGRGRLSESNISEALREVRIALLEADVALPVVQAVIQRIKVRAVGQEVLKSLTPGQALIKIVRDELTLVMGAARSEEHTSELQSLMRISYAVFCLKKKNKRNGSHNRAAGTLNQ